jgi:hypothetical protein
VTTTDPQGGPALVHECPTRLHEADRLVLLPGLLAVRPWGLAWLVPLATAGLLLARAVPPAAAGAAVAAVAQRVYGQAPPPQVAGLVAQLLPVVVGCVAGLVLATWQPYGMSPRALLVVWLRHRLAPPVYVWRPGADYPEPPATADEGPAGGRVTRGEEALSWWD